MASVNRLRGPKFVMVDGTTLVTEVLMSDSEMEDGPCPCLSFVYQDMVVGLDITWFGRDSDDAILALCTRVGCVHTTVKSALAFRTLEQFLHNKDIIFVGVRMKEDVEKLRNLLSPHGLRNVVDLGELASGVLDRPQLLAVGVRILAYEVLSLPFKSRSLSGAIVGCNHPLELTRSQIECATIDAYAAYKIGKKLLGF